jgi:hypothetical protein
MQCCGCFKQQSDGRAARNNVGELCTTEHLGNMIMCNEYQRRWHGLNFAGCGIVGGRAPLNASKARLIRPHRSNDGC